LVESWCVAASQYVWQCDLPSFIQTLKKRREIYSTRNEAWNTCAT
jgi:hypothetical protein